MMVLWDASASPISADERTQLQGLCKFAIPSWHVDMEKQCDAWVWSGFDAWIEQLSGGSGWLKALHSGWHILMPFS